MTAKDFSEQDDPLVEEIMWIEVCQSILEHQTWAENPEKLYFVVLVNI
jgi:hypothetical protein